jgi:hypothetical protein
VPVLLLPEDFVEVDEDLLFFPADLVAAIAWDSTVWFAELPAVRFRFVASQSSEFELADARLRFYADVRSDASSSSLHERVVAIMLLKPMWCSQSLCVFTDRFVPSGRTLAPRFLSCTVFKNCEVLCTSIF